MLPEDWIDAEIDAEFRAVVEEAMAWAVTDNKRDQVMNALHDVLVGLDLHDGEGPES
jgi:hypothetical protein